MKALYLLFIFVIIGSIANGQSKNDKLADLQQELENATSDTAKVQILCTMSLTARSFDLSLSEEYSKDAYETSLKTNNPFYVSKAINAMATNIIYRGEYNKGIIFSEKALDILNADTINISKNSSAENNQLGQIYNNLGMAYDFKSNYALSIHYYLSAADIFKKIENPDGLGVCYNNLGISYLYIEDYDKSKEYFQKSFELYIISGDTNTAYQAKMNLGIINYYKGELDSAISSFKETGRIMQQIGNLRSYGHCLTNIADVYSELDMYDSALYYFHKGIEVDLQLEDKEGLGTDYRLIGKLYYKMGDFQKAKSYFVESLNISLESDRKIAIKESYESLYQIEQKTHNYEKALEYHILYTAYSDSIKTESSSKKIGKIEAENEFNKQLAVQDAKHEQKLKIEAAKRRQQSLILYFSLGIIGVILFFVYMLIKSLKQTRAQKELVQEAKVEIEQKNSELLDSIKYAQRIQDALLKDDASLEGLPTHFILFQPKDIVSGDFYWSYRIDDYWYLAAADCTGHGVPGAMLTMLGTAYLNEICASGDKPSPGHILDALKAKITKELSQTGVKGESKDGMDISLIRIDLKAAEIEWAGANNPLYYISNNELTEIKANKQPIGFSDIVEPFQNHKIPVQKGDSIYLFTDGYADQFGGEKGKKFKYSNFKTLLLETDKKAADDQKQLLAEHFESWRGSLEQIDDVCVIGVRV